MLENITINTQSSTRIDGDIIVYFDPFRIHEDPHDADLIFFTHPHPDHFSPEDYSRVAKKDTIFAAPESMLYDMKKAGISEDRIVLLNPGDMTEILGIPVEAVPAYNIGKPMHPARNQWLGYVVTIGGERLYICGDMDAGPENKAVSCDAVFVPIGGTFTMNAKKAAEFVNELKPRIAVPIHYGSIVGDKQDEERFIELVDEAIEVEILLNV